MPSLEARPPCSASSLLLLLLSLVLAASVATSQDDAATRPTWLDCGAVASQPPPPLSPSPATSQPPTPSTTTNSSVFRANLLTLLEALPRAASPTGFASLSFGDGRDRAFVRGLCRGDTAPPECLASMQVAVRNLSGSCASSRRAAAWFDKCYLTYADTNVSTSYEENFQGVLYDTRMLADPNSFEQTYYTLMGRLVARAASGGGGGSARMFAVGQAEYARDDPNGTMYGQVQCMRDRSAADCDRCLQNSVKRFPMCCGGHQGGVVLSYDCFLRIQIYTYYDLALDAPPPAAPLPPVPSPSPPAGGSRAGKKRSKHVILAVALPVGTLLVLVVVLVGFYLRRTRIRANKRPRDANTREDDSTSGTYVHPEKFTLPLLRAATGNFAAENKLGEGGFGQVFKGKLPDGQTIAVKRLSKGSSQGFHELKNELVLAAKLRHRNLVQILGVCLEEQEKLVVYEYLPNRSLDTLLFDEGRRRLDWRRRYRIISGIARGLLYLHEESRLRVIHRDLKPSNVLLDEKMNPKISDFGLARAFRGDQSRDVTKRPAGTLGYMSPEYAYCGHVSTKSDMFSFGVMVLEIVTGRRNNGPCQEDANDTRNLLSDVWEKWRAGSAAAEIVDASLGDQYPRGEVLSCVQIGLLCVQKKPELRPGASSVVVMLDSQSTSLQAPTKPAFYAGAAPWAGHQYSRRSLAAVSDNGVTMSEVEPR